MVYMSYNLNVCPDDLEPEVSPIADLIRTRSEAFDFGDAPDTKPLSAEYEAEMDARSPPWLREMIQKRHGDAD